jgi:hypothetical protein
MELLGAYLAHARLNIHNARMLSCSFFFPGVAFISLAPSLMLKRIYPAELCAQNNLIYLFQQPCMTLATLASLQELRIVGPC